jgi:predicted RNA-binding Zn ribbon-like protein
MDPARMARLGETEEPGDRPVAPGSLRLVQRFLNSHNHEFPPEADRLGTPRRAATWLAASGLLASGATIDEPGRRRLVALRDALRAVVAQGGPPPDTLTRRPVTVGVAFDEDGQPRLAAVGAGIDRALSGILAAVATAGLDGSWGRLKACRECRWAFYDRSKNRSGAWCAMRICGNRTKNRSYRARKGATRRSGVTPTRSSRAAST